MGSEWHTGQRNVAVGDIVGMADQNALRGQFRIGRVVSVNPDRKGVVRDVNVRTFMKLPCSCVKTCQNEKQTPKQPLYLEKRSQQLSFTETSGG